MNPRVAAIEPSVIRTLAARKKPSSIDLGLGEPSLLPTMRYFEAAAQWVAQNGCRYTVSAGDPELRAALASHYAYPELDRPDNVLITAGGSQEAVYVAIKALLDPARDELLVVEPAYPVYAKCATLEGIAVRRAEMRPNDGFAFDPERILAEVGPRTRAIAICSPCNPTSRTIARTAVERIARALGERAGAPIYVLHDEVYRELTYVNDAGWFGEVYPHTIAINSLSKSNALTGMRIGWALGPKAAIAAMTKAHGWIASTANTFAQRVALEILQTPMGLSEHAAWYREQRSGVELELAALGLNHLPIEGTFYAAVPIGEVDSLEFAYRLLDESDVVAIPGSIFGASFEGWLRCSWVDTLVRVREGFARIAQAAAPALR